MSSSSELGLPSGASAHLGSFVRVQGAQPAVFRRRYQVVLLLASLFGPVLLILGLGLSVVVRRWAARTHVASAESESELLVAELEADTASSLSTMATLVAMAIALEYSNTGFTSLSARWILLLGGAIWFLRSWPRQGLPRQQPIPQAMQVTLSALGAGVLLAGSNLEGVARFGAGLLVLSLICLTVCCETRILEHLGLVKEAPGEWRDELAAIGVAPDDVRLWRFMMTTSAGLRGQVFLPLKAVSLLTPSQAAMLAGINLAALKHRPPWWMQHRVTMPCLVLAVLVAPRSPAVFEALAITALTADVLALPYSRRHVAELQWHLDAVARDPSRAESLIEAVKIFRGAVRFPSLQGRAGMTDSEVLDRLSNPRSQRTQEPRAWLLTARMLPLSVAVAALPLMVVVTAAEALGPDVEAAFAVGTGLGRDVDEAAEEAAVRVYYATHPEEDGQIWIDLAQQEITQRVVDDDLHQAAIELFLARCESSREGLHYTMVC